MNKHKGMTIKTLWFEKGEYERLKDAIEGGFNDEVLDIMAEINKRGDL